MVDSCAQGPRPQASQRGTSGPHNVLLEGSPIILPLKRVGLQHDRFTKIQLRQGDDVHLHTGSSFAPANDAGTAV